MIRRLAIYLGAIILGLLTGLFSQAAVEAHASGGQTGRHLHLRQPHVPAVDIADTELTATGCSKCMRPLNRCHASGLVACKIILIANDCPNARQLQELSRGPPKGTRSAPLLRRPCAAYCARGEPLFRC